MLATYGTQKIAFGTDQGAFLSQIPISLVGSVPIIFGVHVHGMPFLVQLIWWSYSNHVLNMRLEGFGRALCFHDWWIAVTFCVDVSWSLTVLSPQYPKAHALSEVVNAVYATVVRSGNPGTSVTVRYSGLFTLAASPVRMCF